MITLPRLRKRNLSKGPVPVLDSGAIYITSPERGLIWMITSGPKPFRNWRTGQRLRDGNGAYGPTPKVLRSRPEEQLLGTTETATAMRAEKARALCAKSNRWSHYWGNACIAVC